MKAWGILGEPSQEQVEQWKNMPYGHFKIMVGRLSKKSKGKTLKRHSVEVKRIDETISRAFVEVQAFDADHAIDEAKKINTDELDWYEPKTEPTKTSYRVSQVW